MTNTDTSPDKQIVGPEQEAAPPVEFEIAKLHHRLETAHNAVRSIEKDELSARERAEAAEAERDALKAELAEAVEGLINEAVSMADDNDEKVYVERRLRAALATKE